MVVKHGNTTSLTIGCANDIHSCAHYYYKDGSINYSMEWAILSFDNKSGTFAAPGDSGSIVTDGSRCMGGIITSGAGSTSDMDITYVTSINSVMQSIKVKFPNAHLNPDLHT